MLALAGALLMTSSTGTWAAEGAACVQCHTKHTPGIVGQWTDSKHSKSGVSCLDCHETDAKAGDAFTHYGKTIHAIVTPADCSKCHERETTEFQHSHHAKAAAFVGSLDNILGEIVEGRMAAAQGCQQCHGSSVALLTDASGAVVRDAAGKPRLDPATWPNTGIGRINLDGSQGSCTACHSRHSFSKAMARQPETCGKCHMGPDHPQIEIFNESKHGIAYQSRKDEMNLKSDKWVVGKDYSAAPTCATCHMSATPDLPITHDVGERISWTLRPVISKKLEQADQRRDRMKQVCASCHASDFVGSFYNQYDAGVSLYNGKFAEPAQKLMTMLKEKGRITPTPFDDKVEWSFYHLWHHEGRRARMGLSMQGPDYTQWHGFFEVAQNFYFDFLPEVREAARGDADIVRFMDDLMKTPEHSWTQGMTREQLLKVQEFYKKRYGQ